jgi:hypothetical protein
MYKARNSAPSGPARIGFCDRGQAAHAAVEDMWADFGPEVPANVARSTFNDAFTLRGTAWTVGPTDSSGAEPYKRDPKTLDFYLIDAGHFALETNGAEIAKLMREFLGKHVVTK